MRLAIFIYIIAATIGTIATPARSEPPPFTGSEQRGTCPKNFHKVRGKCWRRIYEAPRNLADDDEELQLEQLEAEIGRRLEDLDRGRKAKQ